MTGKWKLNLTGAAGRGIPAAPVSVRVEDKRGSNRFVSESTNESRFRSLLT
jgi:hypothetical protein